MDILLYGSLTCNDNDLVIPHPRIEERAFVLQPLCDISKKLMHPVHQKSMSELLQGLAPRELQDLHSVIPFGKTEEGVQKLKKLSDRPIVMGVLNVTPDSFTDGGVHFVHEDAINSASIMISQGAEIIDVGGESTRPGAEEVNISEEIRRVVPVIRGIKEKYPGIVVSIDTRKAQVAKHALMAGADMVNDVSGGSFDDDMFAVVESAYCPMVIMHSR